MTPLCRHSRAFLHASALVSLLVLGLALGLAHSAQPANAVVRGEAVENDAFEQGTSGWRGFRATVRIVHARDRGNVAEVRLRRRSRRAPTFSLVTAPRIQVDTDVVYSASAAVRARAGSRLCLSVREFRGRALGSKTRCLRAKGGWQSFAPLAYSPRNASSRLAIAVVKVGARHARSFRVDRVSVTTRCKNGKACTPAGSTGSTGSTTTTAPQPPPATTTAAPGTTTTAPGTTTSPVPPPAANVAGGPVGAQFHCAWAFYTNADRDAVLD